MGRLKPTRHQTVNPPSKNFVGQSNPRPEKKPQHSSSKQTERDLKQQIQELGGDEDDYKLVENADSDSSDVQGVKRQRKVQSNHNDVTLHRDIANLMKDLNFSKLQETAKGKGKAKENGKEKQDEKVHKPTKHFDTKAKDIDSSNRDRKASSSHPDKNTTKEKATRVSNVAKAEQNPTTRHIKFSQNETETRFHSGKGSAKTLIITPSPHWYSTSSAPPLHSTVSPPVSSDYLATCQSRAQSIIDTDAETYIASSAHASSASDARFISRVLSSGTLSDRLSALTLMVQASPLHNMRALETLKGMAGKKGREESLKALRAIVDWWTGGGAPDRKLKYFRDQQLTHPDATDAHFAVWFFEDWLKKYFFNVLESLESLVTDPLSYVRKQAMHFIFQLLRDKPEQEQNLLRLLVHRLNDSEKSIASKASHYILQILQVHPQMKKIVAQEIAGFVLRPTIGNSKPALDKTNPQKSLTPSHSAHCRYYASITFNQIVLTSAEGAVADFLIDIYFGMFKEILGHAEDDKQEEDRDYRPKNRRGHIGHKKKSKSSRQPDGTFYTDSTNAAESDQNAKLISAILTGINRALPFAEDIGKSTQFASHINTLFRITHASSTTFAVSLQSLMLLLHVCTSPKFMAASTTSPADAPHADSMTSLPSRFFRTLYASILDSRLSYSASSSKHASYLNLLLKAVKNDPDVKIKAAQKSAVTSQKKERKLEKRKTEPNNSMELAPKRSSALTKRYLQTLISGTGSGGRNEIMCAGMFFIGQLMEIVPNLTLLIDKIPSSRTQIQEMSTDQPRDRSLEKSQKRSLTNPSEEKNRDDVLNSASKRPASSLNTDPKTLGSLDQPVVTYDPKKRDPQYANAEYAGLWELIPLQSHYHPSVSLHAHQLLTHSPVTTTPDLGLNTLSHFLDRFVYKNAKQKITQKGTSAMQRAGAESEAKTKAEIEVNTDKFKNMQKKDVPVDQIFFHNFFTLKHDREVAKGAKADKRKKKKSAEDDADEVASIDSVSDDEEEKEIWKAMKKSIPELEISDDEDDEDLDVDADQDEDEHEDEDVEEDKEADNDTNDGLPDDDDDSALDFMEDMDDLLSETGSLKALVPWASGDASENDEGSEAEWGGFADDGGEFKGKGKKRDREEGEGKMKKKRRTGMGTFASYDDYREMIENAQEDDI